jgi:hypothetical protein
MNQPEAYIAKSRACRKDGYRKNRKGRKWPVGETLQIYAIGAVESVKSREHPSSTVGMPPYYKVVGVSGGELVLEELVEGSQEFNKVRKMVGIVPRIYQYQNKGVSQKRLLNQGYTKFEVTKEDVVRMLST